MENLEKSRKAGLGLLVLVGLAMVAAYMVGATTLGGALASQSYLTATNQTEQAQQGTTSADQQKHEAAAKEEQLLNSFMSNFTSKLGMDETKLNTAFVDSVNATVDQAVGDGLMTQDEADEAKAMVQKGGFRELLMRGFETGGDKRGELPGDQYVNPKMAIVDTMHRIGVTDEEWRTGMDAGKSLADIASTHNVDAATLKTMILESFKTQLDTAVREGKITQTEADDMYAKFTPEVDRVINSTGRRENKEQPVPGTH